MEERRMQLMLAGSSIISGGDYNNYIQMSNGGGVRRLHVLATSRSQYIV